MRSARLKWLHVLAIMAAAIAGAIPTWSCAQDAPSLYPTRPIRIIVPFAPGASTDILARIAAQRFTEAQFIAFVRARPGQLMYASSGNGTSLHLAGVLFEQYAGAKMLHVPYKGTGGALMDLVTGQVPVAFATVAATLPFVSQGKLRPLGLTTLKRSVAMPDVPTISEAAFPGYEMPNWVGLVAPARTPPEIVAKLNAELTKLQANAESKKRVLDLGAELAIESPQAFGDLISRGHASIGKLIKAAGIRLDSD